MRFPSPQKTLAGVAALSAVLAVSACGSSSKGAAPAAATTKVPLPGVSQLNSGDSPKAVTDYWTPKRIASAMPKPLIEGSEKAGKPSYAADSATPGLSGEPALPTLGNSGTGNTFDARAKQGDNAWVWSKHGVAPARTVGLLVFTGADGKDYSCSGTVIASKNRSTVWTAGHCVFEHGFDQRAAFIPDYHDGQAPLKVWPVKKFFATPQWVNQTNPNYDIAAVTVVRAQNGHYLQDYTGAQGFNFKYTSRTFPVLDFGYPGDLLPSGKQIDVNKLRYCTGTSYGINFGLPGPTELSLHCTMGHGASGGGWLTGVGRNGLGYIIGTNSTHNLRGDDLHAAFEGLHSVASTLYSNAAR